MLQDPLRDMFFALVAAYTRDEVFAAGLWREIETCYSDEDRHYHTLDHLQHMLLQLRQVRDQISDWHTTLFALYYHDLIYNVTRHNNEARSAAMVRLRLEALRYPVAGTDRCAEQILCTKCHSLSGERDFNYFIDADLAILGAPAAQYDQYSRDVRREYALYPDLLYNRGRSQVLERFLAMEHIFKTTHFRERYETQARVNLQREREQYQR